MRSEEEIYWQNFLISMTQKADENPYQRAIRLGFQMALKWVLEDTDER